MSPFARRRVRLDGHGGYELRLPAPERALLSSLPHQLDALLGTVGPLEEAPPALERLLPPAYLHDDLAEADYAIRNRDGLLESRRDGLAVLRRAATGERCSAEELEIACTAVNDLRLVLGTALGVTEDEAEPDEHDPDFAQRVCYAYLSGLQAELLEALTGALPPPRPGADDEAPEDPWGEPLGGLRWDGTPLPEP